MSENENPTTKARFYSGNDQIDKIFDQPQVDEAELAKIIDEAVGSEVSRLQTFMDLSKDLRAKQDELDIMAADTLPSAILTSYLSDILEPNNNGDLISIVAEDPNEQVVLDTIFKQMAIPEDKAVYSLLKNGIVIAKHGRQKVNPQKEVAANESVGKAIQRSSNEEVLVAINYGRLSDEISIVRDTTTVFPILENEKCIGYIEVTKQEALSGYDFTEDELDYKDVVIHSKSDYSYVKFGVNKSRKPLQLRVRNEQGIVSCYDIDTGCSLLENSYAAWKTLSILQDSVVLASLIRNASTIIVQTEAGDMSDAEIQVAKLKLKSLFEGKLSLGQNGMKSYLSPQAKPNYVYSFTSGGVGELKTETVGGEYNPGQLYYLDPFINQFFGGMNAPKQQFGFGDSAGLDGGGAVEEYTKRYLSTVSMFKRLLSKFIKNCIDNILTSRGLFNLIDKYEVKIYKAYKEEDQQVVQMQQQQLQMLQELYQFLEIEDPVSQREMKLAIIKKTFSDKALLDACTTALMKKTPDPEPEKAESDDSTEVSGGDDNEEISPEAEDLLDEIEAEDFSEEMETEETEELPELPEMIGNTEPEDLGE